MLKIELSHTLAPSAHAVFLNGSKKNIVTTYCDSRGIKPKNFLFYCIISLLYSYMNKLLCVLFTCINLSNEKD